MIMKGAPLDVHVHAVASYRYRHDGTYWLRNAHGWILQEKRHSVPAQRVTPEYLRAAVYSTSYKQHQPNRHPHASHRDVRCGLQAIIMVARTHPPVRCLSSHGARVVLVTQNVDSVPQTAGGAV